MLGLGTSLVKGGMAGRQYVKDGLKLYMPYKKRDGSLQFVGTGSTSLDGVDDYINIADDSTLDITGDWTISAWVKLGSGMSGYHRVIGKQVVSGSDLCNYGIGLKEGAKIGPIFNDGSWRAAYYESSPLSRNTWYHIVGQWNDSEEKFYNYIDGSLVDTTTVSGAGTPAGNNESLLIGLNEVGSSEFFEGNIKNVAIWSRVLTATEVQNVMYKSYAEVSGRLASGLVSWWALDVDYTDYHGDNDGTNVGSTLDTDLYGGDTPVKPRAIDNAPTVQADAIGSGSALFDGVDDYITLSPQAGLSNFTISCWAKASDWDVNAYKQCVGSWTTGGNEDWFTLRIDSSGRIEFDVDSGDDDGGKVDSNYTHSLVDNTWHHLVGVCNQTTNLIYLYLDGVEVDTTAYTDNTTINPSSLAIGARPDGAEFWDGNICQVGLWSAALTQAQIQSIMEKTYEELTASERTNLVSYWALDEDTGYTPTSSSALHAVLDKTDETFGAEMFTNGENFTGASGATPPDGWSVYTNGTFTIDDSSGSPSGSALKIEHNGSDDTPRAGVASITTVVGQAYKLSFKFKKGTATNGIIYSGSVWGNTDYGREDPTATEWTTYEWSFIATDTSAHIIFGAVTTVAGEYSWYDDISLKPYNGNAGILT